METTTTTTEIAPATVTRTRVEREEKRSDHSSDFIVWVLLALVAFAVCGQGRGSYHRRHHRPTPVHHIGR